MSMARTAQRRVARARNIQRSAPALSDFAEAAPVGKIITGLDGQVRYLNPAVTRLLGYQHKTSVPLDGFGLFHPTDAGAARLHLERLARGEADHYRGEHRVTHFSGRPIWAMLAAALSRDGNGDLNCLIIQMTSIELQKQAEEAQAYLESRWNFALESARQGVWDHDLVNDKMFYSRMWRIMRAIPPNEVIGEDFQEQWLSRIHPDDVATVLANVRRQAEGDETLDALEYRERTRDGRYIWILSRGRPVEWDEHGNPTRTLGTDTDITHLKTIEDELSAEKERLRVTLEAMADGMIATDTEGCVTFINPAAERLIGYTDAEARGIRVDMVFPLRKADTGQMAPCPAQICLAEGRVVEADDEVVLAREDGIERDIRCSASPVISSGRVEGTVLVFQDVTQSRALKRQLVHSASHDDLTGLPNRAAFDRALETAIASAQDQARQHCLLYIDLDRFKPVNDTAGHAAGDALLKQVAATIRGTCRGDDFAARIGGDEFAVLLEDCPLTNGLLVAEKIVGAIGALVFSWARREYRIGASIGVTAISKATPSPLGFLGEADAACYAAKGRGRGTVACYAELVAHP